MDDTAMKLGLLLESAQTHQTLAEATLEQLKSQVSELAGIAREEIRTTLLEELQDLTEHSRRATASLRRLGVAANLRIALWSIGIAVLACAVPLAAAWWLLPSRAEVAALRAERDALAAGVAQLRAAGGRVELRPCGPARRLCVRVDRSAPAYGAGGEFLVVKGY
jgi:hypothetical protein